MEELQPSRSKVRIPCLVVESPAVDSNTIRQMVVRSQLAQLSQQSDGRVYINTEDGSSLQVVSISGTRPPDSSVLRWVSEDIAECLQASDLCSCVWESCRTPLDPAAVVASYKGRFTFREENLAEQVQGFRPPQLGAIHAVLGYWSTKKTEPATVVIPTGTGKTDVMIGLVAAAELDRLIVLVPSDALRTQLADKFLELGILQEFGILDGSCHTPVVGLIRQGFSSAENAAAFARQCNVMISTPQALMASGDNQRAALLDEVGYLFVDEAHHVVADTWDSVRARFSHKRVVQFTATPYREDKKALGGKIIYDFPLREAQRLCYFKKINYRSVVHFADEDGTIARTAVAQLDADQTKGQDHLIMARVSSISRAREVLKLYQGIAAQYNPITLHSQITPEARDQGLADLRSRRSRIIVCVDMLGEGFDMPQLKIAAIHDPHKSLGITLQFIGRFTRTAGDDIGEATVVVSRPRGHFDDQIRKLYAENADWNEIISDLSTSAIGNEEGVQDFNAGFTVNPLDLTMESVSPKMSTVVYRAQCADWNSDAVTKVYPVERLLTYPYSVNEAEAVLWFVTQNVVPVPWGVSNALEDVVYELFVAFYDRALKLLFINSSHNEGHHEKLAEALCGSQVERIQGLDTYRAFADIAHLVPTNIGTRDIRNRSRSHTRHAGGDVTHGLTAVDTQTKSHTDLFAKGYSGGVRTSIGVSMRGRIWSFDDAPTIKHWVDWCRKVGPRVTNPNVNVDDVLKTFIRPKPARVRPALVALAVEWPEHMITNVSENLRLVFQRQEVPVIDTAMEIRSFNTTGPIEARLRNEKWSLDYDIRIDATGLHVVSVAADAEIRGSRGFASLAAYLEHHGLSILFENEVEVDENCMLLQIDRDLEPFPKDRLTVLDWTNVDLKKESQGPTREANTVQARTIEWVCQQVDWDIVLDDDSSYETADIVAMKVDNGTLHVHLTHCKFSSEDSVGARVSDLYEVCGQAMKSVVWRNEMLAMMENLRRRETNRQRDRGHSGLIVGTPQKLMAILAEVHRMKVEFTIAISQPGLSASGASGDQLRLLASSDSYVRQVTAGSFEVYCSA